MLNYFEHRLHMINPKQHAGRAALVTGGASGIGLQVAHDLAQRGAQVCIADRNAPAAEEAARAITAAGGQASARVVDLADVDAVHAMLARLPSIDILINNAGIVSTRPATEVSLAQWNATLAVNLTAPMVLTQHVLASMREKKWGRVVNVSSISGVRAGTGRLAYGTSKAALIAMTGQFAIETAEWGVTVNAIAPGFVDTPMIRTLHGSSKANTYLDVCPMNRFCSAGEVSAAVLFFCADESAFITGQTLGVDGGYLASGLFMRSLFDIPAATPAQAAA
jgi:NAD(P)-dependent dehydrogenase (short-subunit alcohol dehydrogenase family)